MLGCTNHREHLSNCKQQQQHGDHTGTGGAQRSARHSGAKSKPPKPPVRLNSLPSASASLVNVAPAAMPVPSASVAIDPAALLSGIAVQTSTIPASSTAAVAAVVAPSQTPAVTRLEAAPGHQQTEDAAGSDRENMAGTVQNGAAGHNNGQLDASNPLHVTSQSEDNCLTQLPQLGLTLSPTKGLSRIPSRSAPKIATPKSARSGTPRGGRGLKGRPPRSTSNLGRTDSSLNTTDSGEARALIHRTSTG